MHRDFSKEVELIIPHLKLSQTYFNFCREHGGLVYQFESKVKCKNASAIERGIMESK